MEKKYIITEAKLKELLTDSVLLSALECGGVDNWAWYYESISDFINNWAEDNNKNPNGNWCIDDIACEDLKLYEELK